jgi:hypothetical protein
MMQTTNFLGCELYKILKKVSSSPFPHLPWNNFDWNTFHKFKCEPFIHIQENISNRTLYEQVIKKREISIYKIIQCVCDWSILS